MNSNEGWYQTAIKKFKINEIPYKKFSGKPTRIGRGGFGLIYKTECNSIGTVTIKEITICIEDDEICIKNFINELKIHSRIEHERIIQFYGISRIIDEGLYYLVLEYANQGNLREFLIKKKSCENCFGWEERVRLAIQIVEGLRYLHEILNVAHRDLHTKNILMNDGNIKISDFGLSKNLNSTMSSNNKFFGMIPFIDPQKLNHGKNYVLDKRSDIYGLGMILWEISSCQTPFYGEDLACLSLKICRGLKEKSVKGTPMEYKHIYTSCWEIEPNSRPLIEGVLSRLRSISLEPVFEKDDKISTICLFQYPDTSMDSMDSTSGYSNNISSLTIPTNFDEYSDTSLDSMDSSMDSTPGIIILLKNKNMQSEFYAATWLDGSRELWDNESQQWNFITFIRQLHGNFNSNYISDLDLCIYSDYKAKREFYDVLTKLTVYAAATAPEILRGEIISIKSDIYSLEYDPEKRQFEDADSRGLQINPPLQISPPLQINTPS
ncbi:kinase-like protein [Rhizophagus irregularis]|uniref:Kinase-like protein n=1 Tax=Rhizophagus irregularis TaxID=588596 RepID=A0A2I1EJP9_9GLOM|nr:kinase-like protein [Rhizophagus irregularis]PKY22335.1 kinase-like protein [Rhizophagus irregularis]